MTVPDGASHYPLWLRDLGTGGPRGLLAWQALTSSVGIFLATALTALYLVGPAGLGDRAAAATLAAGAGVCILATPPAARLIRVLTPKRFAILSCAARGVLFILLPLIQEPVWTVTVVVLIGLCEAAAFSVYQVIVAEALGEGARNEALAIRRTLGNLGFTIGGVLTAFVVGRGSLGGYRAAFVGSGVALLISGLVMIRLPQPEPAEVPPPSGTARRGRALRDGRFIGMIAVASVLGTSLSLLTVGLPLWVLRATEVPTSVVGWLMVINTLLVVLLQVRLARGCDTWSGARRAVIRAAACFGVSVAIIAVTGVVAPVAAVALLVLAVVIGALAEMYDSAGWWTLTYEYPSAEHRVDYLAAFDVVTPVVNIAGPPLMIAVVALGPAGWLLYAAAFAVAAGAAVALLPAGPSAPVEQPPTLLPEPGHGLPSAAQM